MQSDTYGEKMNNDLVRVKTTTRIHAAQVDAAMTLAALKELEQQFEREIAKAFPRGIEVSYRHGETLRYGRVLQTSGNRIQLRAPLGREHWIYAYRILDEIDPA